MKSTSPKSWIVVVLTMALAIPAVGFLILGRPLFYDTDSYYHLAVARGFSQMGWAGTEAWLSESLRASALGLGFGDKEFGFHALLSLFSISSDPILGGQIAHTLLISLVFATITWLSFRSLGWWSIALPFWIAFSSMELSWRLVRLRPETLALLLFLLALGLAGRGRYRMLGLVSFAFTLSYTAFHAFVGLFGLIFGFRLVLRRRFEPQLVAYPLLGSLLALVVHPYFPDNLSIWVLQSFDFFQEKASMDMGTEILPNSTDVLLMVNLGWFVGLAVMIWARHKVEPVLEEDSVGLKQDTTRTADAFLVAAIVFSFLYLLMSRFSLYAMSFTTLAVVLNLESRGFRIGRWAFLPWGERSSESSGEVRASSARLPTAALFLVACLISVPEAARQFSTYQLRTEAGPKSERIVDRVNFSKNLPAGAKVAARWQQTPIYLLWAPQARYLNVLDPIFQARPYPEIHAAQAELFSGHQPDVPRSLLMDLDSEFLAYSLSSPTGALTRRLRSDPRVVERHRDLNVLWQLSATGNEAFVLDWEVETVSGEWVPYPRSETAAEIEGFVDTRRVVSDAGCVRLRHRGLPFDHKGLFEFSPWGPSSIEVESQPVVQVGTDLLAILGEGVLVSLGQAFEAAGDSAAASGLEVSEGPLVTVVTCYASPERNPGISSSGSRNNGLNVSGPQTSTTEGNGPHRGFYLRRLGD